MKPSYLRYSLRSIVLAILCGFGGGMSQAATVAKMTPGGDGLEVEYLGAGGATEKEVIPVHRTGSVRYFSVGVGQEERMAQYPLFPLKMIFVVGHKAYLSQVSVTITDREGKVRLQIPPKQVTGPWLFLDLPHGNYDISAERVGKATIKKHVTLSAKGTTTIYLRWKEETA